MEYLLDQIRWPGITVSKLTQPAVAACEHIVDHVIPSHRNNYHPHLLGHRALALFSALLIALKVSVIAALSFGPVLPAMSSAITAGNIIQLTNQSRQQYQLPQLTENQLLDAAAQAKANDMLAKGYFSHNTPDGHTPWDFIVQTGYNYITAGENLAVNFTEAENVEQAWMNSPGHKANILNKNYEDIGIGISQGVFQGHSAIFVVQMFGTQAEQKITLSDTPTKVQTQAVPVPVVPAVKSLSNHVTMGALAITDAQTTVENGTIKILATVSPQAVKVLARYGQAAIMLLPTSDTAWTGEIPLNEIAAQNTAVRLEATDMSGNKAVKQLAEFSPSTSENYQVVSPAAPSSRILLLGRAVDLNQIQDKFYLLFIACMLTSLVLAIGIKRHVQHLDMIANSSFVIVLATLLWFTG